MAVAVLAIDAAAAASAASLRWVSEPDCAEPARPRPVGAYSIAFEAQDRETAEHLERGLDLWRSCATAADLPALVTGGRAARRVRVEWDRGSSGTRVCGFFAGDRIRVFSWAVDDNGRDVRCSPPSVNLAHEVGHVLGLADAPARAECRSHVMAIDDPRIRRSVQTAECRAAAEYWMTAQLLGRRQGLAAPARPETRIAALEAPAAGVAGVAEGGVSAAADGPSASSADAAASRPLPEPADYIGFIDMSQVSTSTPRALRSASMPGHFAWDRR